MFQIEPSQKQGRKEGRKEGGKEGRRYVKSSHPVARFARFTVQRFRRMGRRLVARSARPPVGRRSVGCCTNLD